MLSLILTIIAILGFIVTVIFVIVPWASIKIAPIVVKPDKITLKEQPWQISTSFYVQNRTKDTLSPVWIKVSVDESDIKSKDILIDSKDEQNIPWESISNISINYTYVRMDGIDDEEKQCIFFIIHHLYPQATQTFSIKIEPKTKIEEHQNPRLLLKCVRHSKEPVKILKQNEEIAYIFTTPENFTIKSVSLKMRKE